MALLAKFNSKKMNIIILITFILQQVSGLEKNLDSSLSFGQAALPFCLPGATSCSSQGAFHLSELAGLTIAWPVSLKMK